MKRVVSPAAMENSRQLMISLSVSCWMDNDPGAERSKRARPARTLPSTGLARTWLDIVTRQSTTLTSEKRRWLFIIFSPSADFVGEAYSNRSFGVSSGVCQKRRRTRLLLADAGAFSSNTPYEKPEFNLAWNLQPPSLPEFGGGAGRLPARNVADVSAWRPSQRNEPSCTAVCRTNEQRRLLHAGRSAHRSA